MEQELVDSVQVVKDEEREICTDPPVDLSEHPSLSMVLEIEPRVHVRPEPCASWPQVCETGPHCTT